MGYSIYLKGESFDHDGWVEDLGDCGLDISPMGSQFAELLAEHQPEEMWLHPRTLHYLVKKRGVGHALARRGNGLFLQRYLRSVICNRQHNVNNTLVEQMKITYQQAMQLLSLP